LDTETAAPAAPAGPHASGLRQAKWIAWLWIVLGGLSALYLLWELQFPIGATDVVTRSPSISEWLLTAFGWVYMAEPLVLAVGLVAGIALLQRKPWSRTALVVLSWVMLVLILLKTAVLLAFLWPLNGLTLPFLQPRLVWALLFVSSIWRLGRPEVRAALEPAGSADETPASH
jgi:hypothetical protein